MMTLKMISLCLKLFFVFGVPIVNGKLNMLLGWKVLEFDTPPGYPTNPKYQKYSTFITGIQVLQDIFVIATPRFFPGVPASLSYVLVNGSSSPMLQGYPDWSWHERSVMGKANCQGITSAFRMNLDICGNLWVVDSGKAADVTENCPPSILVFNARSNQFIKRIILPPHVVRNDTVIKNIVLWSDSSDLRCEKVKAYIADTIDPALIVYNSETGQFKRFTHPSMHSNPNSRNFNYFGHSFYSSDGILGLALDKKNLELYYKVFAGTATVKVKLQELENATEGHFPAILLGNSSSQAGGIDFGLKERVLVYSNIADTDLVSYTAQKGEKKLAYSPDSLQYITDMKQFGRNVLVMVDARLQNYWTHTIDPTKINLKILTYRS